GSFLTTSPHDSKRQQAAIGLGTTSGDYLDQVVALAERGQGQVDGDDGTAAALLLGRGRSKRQRLTPAIPDPGGPLVGGAADGPLGMQSFGASKLEVGDRAERHPGGCGSTEAERSGQER